METDFASDELKYEFAKRTGLDIANDVTASYESFFRGGNFKKKFATFAKEYRATRESQNQATEIIQKRAPTFYTAWENSDFSADRNAILKYMPVEFNDLFELSRLSNVDAADIKMASKQLGQLTELLSRLSISEDGQGFVQFFERILPEYSAPNSADIANGSDFKYYLNRILQEGVSEGRKVNIFNSEKQKLLQPFLEANTTFLQGMTDFSSITALAKDDATLTSFESALATGVVRHELAKIKKDEILLKLLDVTKQPEARAIFQPNPTLAVFTFFRNMLRATRFIFSTNFIFFSDFSIIAT